MDFQEHDLRFCRAQNYAAEAAASLHGAYWAESKHMIKHHSGYAIEALRTAADVLGFDLIERPAQSATEEAA